MTVFSLKGDSETRVDRFMNLFRIIQRNRFMNG
jgi:hypothetical protein